MSFSRASANSSGIIRRPESTSLPPAYAPREIPQPEPSFLGKRVYEIMCSQSAPLYVNVTLISSDGMRVSSIRELLALSSPFFQELLARESRESVRDEVPVAVNYRELIQILEFIYIDDCPSLRFVRGCANGSKAFPCGTVNDLTKLARAAYSMNLGRLLTRCTVSLSSLMIRNPHLICVVCEELKKDSASPKWIRKLYEGATFLATAFPKSTLLCYYDSICGVRCGVMHFSNRTAETFFSDLLKQKHDGQLVTNELPTVFQALLVWVSNGSALRGSAKRPAVGETEIFVDLGKGETIYLAERHPIAKRIAQLFDLTLFKPRFLSDIAEAEASGLFDQSALTRAYKKLLFQREGIMSSSDAPTSQKEPRLLSYRPLDTRRRVPKVPD